MVNESDADRIQRERDRRRAEERLRIEREHHRRLHDVEALRRTAPHLASDAPPPAPGDRERPQEDLPTPSGDSPGTPPGQRAAEPHPPSRPAPKTTSSAGGAPRPIGGPLTSPTVRAFLAFDPAERFDIEALNQLGLAPLLHEGSDDPGLLQLIAERSEALMERVKREVDDPLSAGSLLRELALAWYRQSPEDPAWTTSAPDRWGGIFAESRVSGGRLHPWLNVRLWTVYQRSLRDGPVRQRVRKGIARTKVAEAAVSRTAVQQIQAEVAQAFLDDLASHPRKTEGPFPLVRLSELAVRRQVATVNDALAALFNSSETGPFVVLHPNRYPDCDELVIRPPSAGASGAALAFALVSPRSARKGMSHPSPGTGHGDTTAEGGGTALPEGETELDSETVWQAQAVPANSWRTVLDECHRSKRRLDAPPKDYRSRPAYAQLRTLLLQDAELRKAFLAVKWRGRPAGLPLLTSLLQKGTISPEVATDHEYLEAELGELAQGDPQYVPESGSWKITGWTVTRDGSHHDGFRYRAVAE